MRLTKLQPQTEQQPNLQFSKFQSSKFCEMFTVFSGSVRKQISKEISGPYGRDYKNYFVLGSDAV
jgi:uncharacterized protein YegL